MEVETRSDQAVLTITLNRPDVLNSLNNALRNSSRPRCVTLRSPPSGQS